MLCCVCVWVCVMEGIVRALLRVARVLARVLARMHARVRMCACVIVCGCSRVHEYVCACASISLLWALTSMHIVVYDCVYTRACNYTRMCCGADGQNDEES